MTTLKIPAVVSAGTTALLLLSVLPPCHGADADSWVDKLRADPGNAYKIVHSQLDQIPDSLDELTNLLREYLETNLEASDVDAPLTSAVEILGAFGHKPAVPHLAQVMQKTSYIGLMKRCAHALGRIGGEDAKKALVATLMQANAEEPATAKMRRNAAFAGLFFLGDPSVIPLLKTEFNNQNRDVETRLYAASALGSVGDRSGLPFALEQLDLLEKNNRQPAIGALGAIGDDRALMELDRLEDEGLSSAEQGDVRSARLMIEAQQREGEEQIRFLVERLTSRGCPQTFMSWGWEQLARSETDAADKALEEVSRLEGWEHAQSRSSARWLLAVRRHRALVAERHPR